MLKFFANKESFSPLLWLWTKVAQGFGDSLSRKAGEYPKYKNKNPPPFGHLLSIKEDNILHYSLCRYAVLRMTTNSEWHISVYRLKKNKKSPELNLGIFNYCLIIIDYFALLISISITYHLNSSNVGSSFDMIQASFNFAKWVV